MFIYIYYIYKRGEREKGGNERVRERKKIAKGKKKKKNLIFR